ncbi:MAG: BamA/TamA family outer membrane protein [Zoogloea sp.]|nr:BamA/TamA family outer membrane protein [Zoogloea sp.]
MPIVLLAVLAGVTGGAHAQEAAAAGEGAGVRLEIADAALRPLLEANLAVLGERRIGGFDTAGRLAILRRARTEVTDLLATEGYFAPVVEGEPDEDGGVRLAVTPGVRTKVVNVDLEFSGDIARKDPALVSRVERLRRIWLLRSGRPFRQADWDAAKQGLLDGVANHDYAAARIVESSAEIDAPSATARLRVVVDSGPPFTFGELDISGLADYPSDLLGRFDPPEPGEPFDLDRLLKFQSSLQNTPYFASVVVDIDRDPAHAAFSPIRVQVSEAKPRNLSFGLGASSNTGFRGELGYRDANFRHRAWNLVTGIRIEQLRQAGYADVFFPPGAEGRVDSIGGLAEHTNIQSLETERRSVAVNRTHLRGNLETRLGVTYVHEIILPEGGVRSISNALATNWSWTRRAVDNLLDPRDGHVLNIQIGGAPRILADRDFLRLYARYQHYLPVSRRDVVILRAEAGATLATSSQGIPQDFLFRTGGAQSVRGYSYQSLGVKQDGAVVGGRYLGVMSAEYVHWLNRQWGAATFVDAGNAVDERQLFRLNMGYGIGARWRSPAGPLAVDLAYGQTVHSVALHFAVAIAF